MRVLINVVFFIGALLSFSFSFSSERLNYIENRELREARYKEFKKKYPCSTFVLSIMTFLKKIPLLRCWCAIIQTRFEILMHIDTKNNNNFTPGNEENYRSGNEENYRKEEYDTITARIDQFCKSKFPGEVEKVNTTMEKRKELLKQITEIRSKIAATKQAYNVKNVQYENLQKKLQDLNALKGVVNQNSNTVAIELLKSDIVVLDNEITCSKERCAVLEEKISQGKMNKVEIDSNFATAEGMNERLKTQNYYFDEQCKNLNEEIVALKAKKDLPANDATYVLNHIITFLDEENEYAH